MLQSKFGYEPAFVNDFIRYTLDQPLIIENEPRRLFVWGNEVWLANGKGNTKAGKIDLLASDEFGNAWLIEAKLCKNIEWNANIWKHQLGLYAKSLEKKSEQEIALSVRRYMGKLSTSSVFASFIAENVTSLSEAFCQWACYCGKSIADGRALYEKTLGQIKNGQLIHCVLSDMFSFDIWENRPQDDICRAYIAFDGEKLMVLLDDKKALKTISNSEWQHESWETFLKNKESIKPTKDNIPLLLANSVIPTYEHILSFLYELGWNGIEKSINKKAFVIDLATVYDVPLRIHIGWVDADGQQDIRFRTPYEYGLKFNIDFRFFKRHESLLVWEKGFALAKELFNKAHYDKRGKEFSFRDSTLNAVDVKNMRWDGEMYRFINQRNRDYIGLSEEKADLLEVFQFLKRVKR